MLKARFYSLAVDLILRAHNISYILAGRFAKHLEPDGLHPKHRIVRYRNFFLDHVQATDSVLDIGCGKGTLTRALG